MKAHENPFRSSVVERIRYALAPDDLDQLARKALTLRCCCLLGPHGTGKTTLLEDLEPIFKKRGRSSHWLCLNNTSSKDERDAAIEALRSLPTDRVFLFDGAEVLNLWQQFKLYYIVRRRKLALLATVHRKGPLPILYRTAPNWRLTRQLVRQLSNEHYSADLIEQAQLAFDSSGGNVREVFRACYWQLANNKKLDNLNKA